MTVSQTSLNLLHPVTDISLAARKNRRDRIQENSDYFEELLNGSPLQTPRRFDCHAQRQQRAFGRASRSRADAELDELDGSQFPAVVHQGLDERLSDTSHNDRRHAMHYGNHSNESGFNTATPGLHQRMVCSVLSPWLSFTYADNRENLTDVTMHALLRCCRTTTSQDPV